MARFGSIPREGSSCEFLYEQRQLRSAFVSAAQQVVDGGLGFGAVTAGLQDMRPLIGTLQMVWALESWTMLTKRRKATILNLGEASILIRQ